MRPNSAAMYGGSVITDQAGEDLTNINKSVNDDQFIQEDRKEIFYHRPILLIRSNFYYLFKREIKSKPFLLI